MITIRSFLNEIDEAQRKYRLPVDQLRLMASLRILAPDMSETKLREIAAPYRDEWPRRLRGKERLRASAP